MGEHGEHEAAFRGEMVRRNLLAATTRAIECLEAANTGLQRLSGNQHDRYRVALASLELLAQALKFDR